MSRRVHKSFLLAFASLLPFSPVAAQTSAEGAENNTVADDFHGTITVRAPGLDRLDVLAGTSVLEGESLQRTMHGQLGEMLASLPGVTSTGFAPGAARPVIRGFSGERVRVLVDGIGTIDASNTSDDHAVSFDPLTTDRIEVLRGPAVLLYGSQAIGGAVNIVDKRIPHAIPDEPVHIDTMMSLDSVSNRREIGASVDVPVADFMAVHVDGSWRKTDDLEIPGFVASDRLRAYLLEEAEEEEAEGHEDEAEELREAASLRGTLPNSWTETRSAGAGITLFSGSSNVGFSFGYYDTNYGIPGIAGFGHVHGGHEDDHEVHDDHDDHDHDHDDEDEHGHGDEDVYIGLKQYRLAMRGEVDLGGGFFETLHARLGYSDYTHTEFEGDEIGTVFEVRGVEGRLELVQQRRENWRGSLGAQFYHRTFDAFGAEAYVAPNETDQFAFFALQEFDLGPVELELAGRYERTDVSSQVLGVERSFDAVSGAAGLSYTTPGNLRFGVNLSHAERAPSAEELFANGPHIATRQFEIGDPGLVKERALGLEGYVRGNIGPASLSLAVHQSWFSDFIYLAATGMEEDGLPVFQQTQNDARYFGIEGELSFPLLESESFDLKADLRGDYIRASLSDGTALPRIPPLSLAGGLEAHSGPFTVRGEVEWFGEQTRTAAFETPTDSFALVNMSLAWKPLRGAENVTVMLQVDNIFDQEGRRHSSFTKEFVPMAGRNFRVSLRKSL